MDDHLYVAIMCTHCGHLINVPVYCGNRFCSVCGRARLSRVRRRLKWLVDQIPFRRDYVIKFLTLTISNQPKLAPMLKHITSSFRRLRQRAAWKKHVLGGAYVLEVTGSPGNWHAHIHIVIQSKWFPWKILKPLWVKCSGSQGVWIDDLPKHKIVHYLSKYLSKSSVLEPLENEVAESLKGFRLFHPFGDWFATSKRYVDEKPGCPECHSHVFCPVDLIYGTHVHPERRAPPGPAPSRKYNWNYSN